MFMEIDLVTPIRQGYLRNLKVKNTVLKYWPTKLVDGIEVFDKLYMWQGHVPDDTGHKELYKLLGTSVEKLKAKNWAHVVSAWMYFKPYHLKADSVTLSDGDVVLYINENSELGKEYEVKFHYTQEYSGPVISGANKITDQQIIDLLEGGYDSLYDPAYTMSEEQQSWNRVVPTKVYSNSMITYDVTANPCTFASIMDTDDDLFSSTTTIVSKSVKKAAADGYYNDRGYSAGMYGTGNYTLEATISYKFKRIKDAGDAEVAPLIVGIRDKALTIKRDPFSFYTQVSEMLHRFNPVLPGELAYSYSTIELFGHDGEDSTTTTANYVRKDGAAELKPTDFSKMLKDALDSDYQQESCHGWKCFLGFILSIVIIVVAVIAVQPELIALDSTAVAGTVAYASIWCGLLALNLTVGSLLMGFVANYLGKHGEYGIAISFGRSLVMLNKLTEVVGYVSMITGIAAMWQGFTVKAGEEVMVSQAKDAVIAAGGKGTEAEIAAELANHAAVYSMAVTESGGLVRATFTNYVHAGWEMITGNVTSVFSNFSRAPMAVMNKVMGWLNTGLKAYTQWINPIKMPPAGQPAESEGEPERVDGIAFKEAYFNDYLFLDMNAQMDEMPANMTTRGLTRETLGKYYDA